jgi:hypothetical protein
MKLGHVKLLLTLGLLINGFVGATCSSVLARENPCQGIWLKPKSSTNGNLRLDKKPLDCSIPNHSLKELKLGEQALVFFLPACETHDLCYQYGSYTYQKSRKNCDDDFYSSLTLLCSQIKDSTSKENCLIDSGSIYAAVRIFGFPYFLSPVESNLNDYPIQLPPHNNDRGEYCDYQNTQK